jgi:hypothetical protein
MVIAGYSWWLLVVVGGVVDWWLLAVIWFKYSQTQPLFTVLLYTVGFNYKVKSR